MASEIEKREKARRVWRLNKKEGIPVLEALESVNIGKDAYYRLKNKHEEEWKDEIMTAEQVNEELEQLREEVAELREESAEIEETLNRVEEKADEIEMDADWYDRLAWVDEQVHEQKVRMDTFAEAVGWDIQRKSDPDARESFEQMKENSERIDFGEIERRVESVETSVEKLRERIESVENRIKEVKKGARQSRRNIESKIPESVFDLI